LQESNVPPQQSGLVSRRRLFRLGVGAATFPVLGALLNACGGSSGGSAASTPAASTAGAGAGAAASGGTIKVGIMHSLSGVMSISEKAVVDAEQLAIAEINAAGGVMGKQLSPVVEDGASDPATFAEKAKKLVQSDKVQYISKKNKNYGG